MIIFTVSLSKGAGPIIHRWLSRYCCHRDEKMHVQRLISLSLNASSLSSQPAHFSLTKVVFPRKLYLYWLVSSHRPEQAPPTMFLHLCRCFCYHGGVAKGTDCTVVTSQTYGSPDGSFEETVSEHRLWNEQMYSLTVFILKKTLKSCFLHYQTLKSCCGVLGICYYCVFWQCVTLKRTGGL